MNTEKYNGWTNYETWKHNLEFVDGNYEYWAEMIPTLEGLPEDAYVIDWDTVEQRIADGLEDELWCFIEDTTEGYTRSVMNSHSAAINWREIAAHIIDAYKEA